MKGQSKKSSLIESLANIAIGYFVSVTAQIVIFPLFGMRPSIGENLAIGALFTIVSLVRSYVLRRLFNWFGLRNSYFQLDTHKQTGDTT